MMRSRTLKPKTPDDFMCHAIKPVVVKSLIKLAIGIHVELVFDLEMKWPVSTFFRRRENVLSNVLPGVASRANKSEAVDKILLVTAERVVAALVRRESLELTEVVVAAKRFSEKAPWWKMVARERFAVFERLAA